MADRRTCRCAGLDWRVVEAGSGPRTLVFLPGALGTEEVFARQLLRFSHHGRVLLVGYPGHADQTTMTAGFEALMDELRVHQACFVGSSLGACWLQVFTHHRPGLAEHLVLGNTFVDPEPLQANVLFQRSFLDAATADAVKARWVEHLKSLPASLLSDVLLELTAAAQPAEELHGRLLTVAHSGPVPLSRVPASRLTVLSCEDDPITHGVMGEALRQAYPHARHERLPSGGHYPHLSNADAYDRLVAEVCGWRLVEEAT